MQERDQEGTEMAEATTDLDWTSTEKELPPLEQVVHTMDSGGSVQDLVLSGNLWWHPDRSMYVYYVPKFWKAKA
jgi:hypothetical protein